MSIFQSLAIVENETEDQKMKVLGRNYHVYYLANNTAVTFISPKWWGYRKYQKTKKFFGNAASKNF